MVNTIASSCLSDGIDFILFTGDLVYTGKQIEDFDKAREILFETLSKQLKVDRKNIFICAGNHDVFRNQELSDIADSISKIKDSSELETFVTKQNGRSFQESLKNLENYQKFEHDFYDAYSCLHPSYQSSLLTIHKFDFQGVRVGIMAINTAWRAIDSDKDRGNLLYPVSIFKDGISRIAKDTDFRILMHHHPFSDLQGWNTSELEDLSSTNFHVSLSGHLHKRKLTTQLTSDGGIFSCSSAATLAFDGTINGYTILDLDLTTYEGVVDFRAFSRSDASVMHQPNKLLITIPRGEKKGAAIQLAKTIRKRFVEEQEKANELFIFYQVNDSQTKFLELFTRPILKSKSDTEIAKGRISEPTIELESILSSCKSWLIYGKDKSGKTCILYQLFLTFLNDFTFRKVLPMLVDCKDYKKGNKAIDFHKIFCRYYEVNANRGIELIKNCCVVLLVDNYDPKAEEFKRALINFYESSPANITVIAVAEERLESSFKKNDLGSIEYSTLYIHELLRGEVRSLANKWPNLSQDKRETILEKIFQIFNQLHIPVNYWTVSLFISIFEKNSDANFHNNFELIQLYIDNLLDRKQLALDKSIKIDFDDFRSYLSSLAYFLLVDRQETVYSATYKEIVDFTDSYRKEHRRFVIDVQEIISLVVDRGIIHRTGENYYTFRLNGVFEYFLALYMVHDTNFRTQVIQDDHFYLSFGNELELYAGFAKNDAEYLDDIYKKTKYIFTEIDEIYGSQNIDIQFLMRISPSNLLTKSIQELGNSIQQSLTFEQQDALITEMQPNQISQSEVTVKKYYEKIDGASENLEDAIHILARVYRNLKIQNDVKTDEVLEYIVDRVCFLGLQILDEAEREPESILPINMSEEKGKTILKLLSTFVPVLIQTFLFDAVAQNDLERIFVERINHFKTNSKNNQLRLFVLYLTLVDIDINRNRHYLTELIEVIEMPILKRTLLIKFYYYLMFKANNNRKLEKFIQDLIQTISIDINEKVDLGIIQRNVEKTKQITHYGDILSKKNDENERP